MTGTTLAEVKPGDSLLVRTYRHPDAIAVVDRTTSRYVIVGDTKYLRYTGGRAGGGPWDAVTVSPATPDDIARVRQEERQRRAFRILWDLFDKRDSREALQSLPAERLEAAYALLTEPQP